MEYDQDIDEDANPYRSPGAIEPINEMGGADSGVPDQLHNAIRSAEPKDGVMESMTSRREWIGRHWMRIILLVGLTMVWAGMVNVAVLRSLNVTSHTLSGRPMGLPAEVAFEALGSLPHVLFVSAMFTIPLCVLKRGFHWSAVFLSIVITGTPIVYVGGRELSQYLWEINRGGRPWETIIPTTIGIAVGWRIGLLLSRSLRARSG